eukprot:1225030-Amphidinium_carterae.1
MGPLHRQKSQMSLIFKADLESALKFKAAINFKADSANREWRSQRWIAIFAAWALSTGRTGAHHTEDLKQAEERRDLKPASADKSQRVLRAAIPQVRSAQEGLTAKLSSP